MQPVRTKNSLLSSYHNFLLGLSVFPVALLLSCTRFPILYFVKILPCLDKSIQKIYVKVTHAWLTKPIQQRYSQSNIYIPHLKRAYYTHLYYFTHLNVKNRRKGKMSSYQKTAHLILYCVCTGKPGMQKHIHSPYSCISEKSSLSSLII